MARFTDFDHFAREILKSKSGPMASAAEDIADEIYQVSESSSDDHSPESLWDDFDSDEE